MKRYVAGCYLSGSHKINAYEGNGRRIGNRYLPGRMERLNIRLQIEGPWSGEETEASANDDNIIIINTVSELVFEQPS